MNTWLGICPLLTICLPILLHPPLVLSIFVTRGHMRTHVTAAHSEFNRSHITALVSLSPRRPLHLSPLFSPALLPLCFLSAHAVPLSVCLAAIFLSVAALMKV